MSEKDDIERRARYVASGGDKPVPQSFSPETPWKKILYRVILVLIYFVTISFFKFWAFGLGWIIVFSLIGLIIFASGPAETTEFVTWAVIIVVIFGGGMWLFTMSPYRGTVNQYYNVALTSLNKVAEAASDFGTQLDCLTKPTLERCTKITDAGTAQKTRNGLEITTLSSESSVAVGKTARLFASIVNQGEADATVKSARMYGGEGKNFKIATNLQCAGCAIGITNEKIIPNSRRDLTADLSMPCEKISTYPFGLNMEYEYSVGASLPVDVLNAKDYDAKIAGKEVFLMQPSASSSSGPVIASISIGVEGYQPIKGGVKNILFAKLTNLGSGGFKLKNAQVAISYNNTHNFTLSSCKLNGVAVGSPINLTDQSGKYYPSEKFVSLSCDMDVKDVDGQKRFVATVNAKYDYNITKSGSAELDETGYDVCNAATTTTTTVTSQTSSTTTSTTSTTAATAPPVPGG